MKRLFSATLILAGFLGSSTALAQDQTTVVRAGRVLNIVSGQYDPNQIILIKNGRIDNVRSAEGYVAPEGAKIVDLSTKTLLPGLIDAHTHLFGDADIQGYQRLKVSTPHAAIKGVKNALITLRAGFTTVRVVGAPGYADVALRDAIKAGEVPGPRLKVAGPPIGITGGHCSDSSLLPFEYGYEGEGVADGPWAIRRKVRQNVKYGVDLIKTCATGGVLSKGTKVGAPQYTLEELKALVDEAHSHGRKVAVHAHGAEGIRNAILAGADSIEHSSFIDKESIDLAKKNGTFLVMDIYNTEYILGVGEKAGFLKESLDKERRVGKLQRENFGKAHRAGVRMAFGSDSAVYPHGQNGRQLSRMVRFGMTPLQALQAATINAAELLDMKTQVGKIAPGFFADIIAVSGDPLQDVSILENVETVIKNGELVD